ncbi:hypothetical protein WMY93_008637 [Mugilogobius chulae]|uniref:Uncharacterized protein n=1 Tax=Mugilogobius chulae TaxID=88201 RepID=A0AAW0PJK0_9GOBI
MVIHSVRKLSKTPAGRLIKVYEGFEGLFNCEKMMEVGEHADNHRQDGIPGGADEKEQPRVRGVAESPGETWSDTEQKIQRVLAENLQLQQTVEVERAHRTGKSSGGGDRARPIVVKLLRYKDRQSILQRAKLLKGSKIFINEDFTDAVRRKRRDLMPELRAARERGDIAYLRFDKLIVHPRNSSTPK